MSFYVKRMRDGQPGWVGPIRSYRQACRELEAWQLAGWDTVIHESTPNVRREVREWQHGADVRLGRRQRP